MKIVVTFSEEPYAITYASSTGEKGKKKKKITAINYYNTTPSHMNYYSYNPQEGDTEKSVNYCSCSIIRRVELAFPSHL